MFSLKNDYICVDNRKLGAVELSSYIVCFR